MKRLLIALFVLALIMPGVVAPSDDAGTGNGQGNDDSGATDSGNGHNGIDDNGANNDSGNGDNIVIAPNRNQIKAGNTEELKNMIQTRNQEMEEESTQETITGGVKNQNQVRLAVHAFLAMEDLVGGIGPQVSEVAREFDNSVQKTIQSEQKIQARDMFSRFFFGGDEVAAAEIEEELNMNQNRIQKLQQLKEQCTCSEELKNMYQEHLQNLEQEQTRLRELAQAEKLNKGLFGWLWK
ncbi:MAG: hypothetical protein KKB03_03640 [Nanoarchaeota archaeon]|nr:hypothetical protein [Nanoarchaeota archaeon]MBU1135378.1 hypothetical protein [Nanoarchaeota archaeon]MBU2520306.1 hypothetical protein [Nanoarchaeota archaeon]